MHLLFAILISLPTRAVTSGSPFSTAKMNAFVTRLMARMSLDEKVGQLVQYSAEMASTGATLRDGFRDEVVAGRVGSLMNAYGAKATRDLQRLAVERTRLKIPLLFAYDVIHGYRTTFPIPLAESSSWDLNLMEQTAAAAAREAAADGLHWTFAPMVDVTRDPRWGRVMEGAGEDPWLGARVAAARTRGLQGSDPGDGHHVLATVKHFAAYGAIEAGREYNSVSVGAADLLDVYLPPYEAAVRAGAATLMTSFNDLNGVPATADRRLLSDVLRRAWGFRGVVISDYTSIPELVRHGVAEDNRRAGQLAFGAGVDVDMQGGVYAATLARDVRQGKVKAAAVDVAARRVLELKYRLGLFDDPYRRCDEKAAEAELMKPENLRLARESARRSIVLLKNADAVLPLKRSGTIAVVGPLADNTRDTTGNWYGTGQYQKSVSLLEGLREATEGKATVTYALGANLVEDQALLDLLNAGQGEIQKDPRTPKALIAEAVAVAAKADVVVVALGESFGMTGEAASRTRLRVPLNQEELLLALHQTGKPIVLVLSNGRPLALELEAEVAHAIVEGWFLGTQSGRALADVLFGDYNPSGKLTMTFPRHEGQVPIYYAARPTGRPANPKDRWTSRYIDSSNEPLYPFGFGLSYTKFEYADVTIKPAKVKFGQKIHVTVPVTNAGAVDGEEVVQLYVRDLVASVTRPVKQLRGFRKVALKAGETQVVHFELTTEDLKFHNERLRWTAEPGWFRVMVGGNSTDVREAQFELVR